MFIPRFRPLLLLTTLLVGEADAQTRSPGAGTAVPQLWNTARATELIRRAQQLRAETQLDTALLSYRADARGYVYFYLDREDTGERNLVKTDQVALDVYWQAPDRAKQRIVGWRDERNLPTNIQYHLDHLAVVHDNFGDLIRLGDGDEVRDVLHPAAPGAEHYYEFRLADSLTLRLPGVAEPVRVYELDVRPRDLAQPGIIGSVFVDRRSGALVRLDFTFTPVSYVDRNLDYINISLDNGLWMGRFWLPNRQRVELRRQIPELDLPAGSVIRGSMRISNYRFNLELSPEVFVGPPVTVAPREERAAFAFEDDLYAELRAEGIGPGSELRAIRRQALELAGQRRLSGLPVTRLAPGAVSEFARYNRAEGAVIALGVSRALPAGGLGVLRGGWAFGAEHPLAGAELRGRRGAWRLGAGGHFNASYDVGGHQAASGVINTLSALIAGRDHVDLFYARGAAARARRLDSQWSTGIELRFEEHVSAELAADFSFFGPEPLRPVRAVDDGTWAGGSASLARLAPAEAASWWVGSLTAEAGTLRPAARTHAAPDGSGSRGNLPALRLHGDAGWGVRSRGGSVAAVRLAAGRAWGELPRQKLFLLGGRGTVPGFPLRAFGGDRFVRVDGSASADLAGPWLRARLHAATGWADVGSAGKRALQLWNADPTGGLRSSAGAGLGVLFDVLHFDVHHGLGRGGSWEFIVETRRSFWDFL